MRRGGGREEVLNPAAKSAGDHRVATRRRRATGSDVSTYEGYFTQSVKLLLALP